MAFAWNVEFLSFQVVKELYIFRVLLTAVPTLDWQRLLDIQNCLYLEWLRKCASSSHVFVFGCDWTICVLDWYQSNCKWQIYKVQNWFFEVYEYTIIILKWILETDLSLGYCWVTYQWIYFERVLVIVCQKSSTKVYIVTKPEWLVKFHANLLRLEYANHVYIICMTMTCLQLNKYNCLSSLGMLPLDKIKLVQSLLKVLEDARVLPPSEVWLL